MRFHPLPFLLVAASLATLLRTSTAVVPPAWTPTYALNESLFVFHDVDSGAAESTFGLVVYGWAFEKASAPADAGELQKIDAQAARVKATNPRARIMTYLNLELGLGWYDQERRAQEEHPGLFLAWKGNGSMIHSDAGPTMVQTWWDYRQSATLDYWHSEMLRSVIQSKSLDGVLFDDVSGFPNEHKDVASAFTPAETAHIKNKTLKAAANFTQALAGAGKYSCIYEGMDPTDNELARFTFLTVPPKPTHPDPATGGSLSSPANASACVAAMRHAIALGSAGVPMVMSVTSFKPTYNDKTERRDPDYLPHLAAFQIARGPHAFYSPDDLYNGDSTPLTDYPELHWSYGAPLGVGRELPGGRSGVFERKWSAKTVRLDCNTYEAEIVSTSL